MIPMKGLDEIGVHDEVFSDQMTHDIVTTLIWDKGMVKCVDICNRKRDQGHNRNEGIVSFESEESDKIPLRVNYLTEYHTIYFC